MRTSLLWSSGGTRERGSIKILESAPNGKYLLAGGQETIEVLSTETGSTISQLDPVHKQGIWRISISPHSNYFCSIGGDGKAVVWSGSSMAPMKKFSIGAKPSSIYSCEFNYNETSLVIVARKEILVFKLHPDKRGKELSHLPMKDRELEAGCCIWAENQVAGADNIGSVCLYSPETLERSFLFPKLGAVNLLRSFGDGRLWCAYQQNLLACYPLDEGGVRVEALERRTPFEVLTLLRLEPDLYLISGVSDQLALVNSAGAFLFTLMKVEGAVLLRALAWDSKGRKLFLARGAVEAYSVLASASLRVFGEMAVFSDGPQKLVSAEVERLFAGGSSASVVGDGVAIGEGETGSTIGGSLDFAGRVVSFDSNGVDFFCVLVETRGGRRLQIFPLDAAGVPQKRGGATLRSPLLDAATWVFAVGAALVIQQDSALILADFSLKVLRVWQVEAAVARVLGGPRRRESLLVALHNGEFVKVSLDCPFTLPLYDHGVEPLSFEVSADCERVLVLDKRGGLGLFELDIGEAKMRPLFSDSKVTDAALNPSYPGLYAHVSEQGEVFLGIDGDPARVLVDRLESGRALKLRGFRAKRLLFFDEGRGEFVTCEADFAPIYAALGKAKAVDATLRLQLAVGESAEILRASALGCLEQGGNVELGRWALAAAGEFELHQFAAAAVSGGGGRVRAEVLALGGRHTAAVDLLLAEREVNAAVEMLVALGKFEQAARVLKTPAHRAAFVGDSAAELRRLQALQAEAFAMRGQLPQALDLFRAIGDTERAVGILIAQAAEAELLAYVRQLGAAGVSGGGSRLAASVSPSPGRPISPSPTANNGGQISQATAVNGGGSRPALEAAFRFFKERGSLPAAREVLLILRDEPRLLDFYVETGQFDPALALYDSMKHPRPDPEKLFVPYAAHLLRLGNFEAALDAYKRLGKPQECQKIVARFVRLNARPGCWALAARFAFEQRRLGASEAAPLALLRLAALEIVVDRVGHRRPRPSVLAADAAKLALRVLAEAPRLDALGLAPAWPPLLGAALRTAVDSGRQRTAAALMAAVKRLGASGVPSWVTMVAQGTATEVTDPEDVLFRCGACEETGFELAEGGCTACGLRMFHCPLSGLQLPLVEIEPSVEVAQALADPDAGDLFGGNSPSTPQPPSQAWINDPSEDKFAVSLKENQAYRDRKPCVSIESTKVFSSMNFERFLNLEGKRFFYATQDCDVTYCANCLTLYESVQLELFTEVWECPLCKDKRLEYLA